MFEWFILFFVLFITLYLIMKKPKTATEKTLPKTKAEQPDATEVTQAAPKKTGPAPKTPKKPQAVASKAKAETEKSIDTKITQEAPEKPSAVQKTAKKTKTAASKAVEETPAISMPERVGLTAGSIWHYLAENGATPVTKLVKALSEEEKIIQRSIGWLAQEGKITLDTVDRIETITLKE